MQQLLWKCPLCRATNVVPAKKCTVCRKPYAGEEHYPDPRIEEAPPDSLQRDSKLFQELSERMDRASTEMSKESIPPRGAIRIVIPNDPLGWLTVVIVVGALATTLAILKSLF